MATTRKSTPGARRGAAKKTSAPRKSAQTGKTAQTSKATQTSKTTEPRKTAQPRKAAAAKESAPRTEPAPSNGKKLSLRKIAVSAAAELGELIGQSPERIIGVDKSNDGWQVNVEVTESRRIPNTTDILAVYEVDVDSDGDVIAYRRVNRYVRGRIEE